MDSSSIVRRPRSDHPEALQRREVGQDRQQDDDHRQSVEQQPGGEQRHAFLSAKQPFAHRQANDFGAGAHVAHGHAAEKRAIGGHRLPVFTPVGEVPATGRDQDAFARAVEHRIEHRSILAGCSGRSCYRAIQKVNKAEEEENDRCGYEFLSRDEPRRKQVPAHAHERQHVRRQPCLRDGATDRIAEFGRQSRWQQIDFRHRVP